MKPGEAAESLAGDEARVVLAEMGDFLPLERGLVDRQAVALLNAIGEGVCLATPEGAVLWGNDRFNRFSARTRDRIAAECRAASERFRRGLGAGVENGERASWRSDIVSADGERVYELVVSPVLSKEAAGSADGEPRTLEAVACVIVEVTESRSIQQKIEAIDNTGRELMRLDADAVRQMHAGERLALLQDKIVQAAHELMHFDHFTIRLLDRDTGRLDLVMSTGLPPETALREVFARATGNGIIGYVAVTGKSYLCRDTSRDPLYKPGLAHAGSSLTTPLVIHDRVIGVFNAESGQTGAFSEEDVRFAEIFSRSIAMALHILDLLVVERSSTNEAVSGRVEGEVREPLDDLAAECEWLRTQPAMSPDAAQHVDRIVRDVEAIRRRIREVAQGPRTILGAEKALRDENVDPALKGRRVLVADDEAAIRETIRDVLERRGSVVTICGDGATAVTALEAAGERREGFDLVVSDIKMPDRNGYEVFSAAKALDREIPVILMTGFGYDPHHSIVRASQEGLQCVLFKPFQMERLLDEVRKALLARAGSAG